MGSLPQFVADLSKFGGNVEKLRGKIVRAVALTAFRDVIMGSPVDTGRFRASWMVGIGVANRAVTPERAKGKTQKATAAASARESIVRLQELTPERVTGKDPVILSNNLPYATRLAAGSSDQAPDGWVDAAVTRAALEANLVKVEP